MKKQKNKTASLKTKQSKKNLFKHKFRRPSSVTSQTIINTPL